ncbi:hypothetical protein AMTRI_Chr04g252390 [Amborella trichopoda]|uniref:Uncharacterized protein n=1 Tax=Amborella trichopoda TaxID=13333 RepID=W1NEY1_AMBTC|nr:uncharacterized oxidoreductase At4g09670 [Amborella trichopoda]ERM94347.1 hypothetical protein AMTR_s00010p00244820 [Amborella trichopoda]|eukprot:XP_006827110.1 uncharacterized oxidoreductase At4g09670 [Amborella trichopoda]
MALQSKACSPQMAENPIRFGILGCATIAIKLSRAINRAPNACLCAVASRSLEKARAFASDNGFPPNSRAYGAYQELLDDPHVDAVYIPLPTSFHIEWAVKAAKRKKHILLEKPAALNVAELDVILGACEDNGIQFMDGTMWMHHPRTAKMKELLVDSQRFGELKLVVSTALLGTDPEFLKNDIRVKPNLDALGSLGDVGWYCIRSILWAHDYKLPKSARALPGPVINEAGVILECGASLFWEDGNIAVFQCSFIGNTTMDVTVHGSKGTLKLRDFIIPFEEKSGSFEFGSEHAFNEFVSGWAVKPSTHSVMTDLPQEVLMVKEFSRLVASIRDSKGNPDKKWPEITRKTQRVLDAVKSSIVKGFETVEL